MIVPNYGVVSWGKRGPRDADNVSTSETGKRSGNRVSSSSKGKRLSLILENF